MKDSEVAMVPDFIKKSISPPEQYRILRDIWKKDKIEFVFWFGIFFLIVPFIVIVELHSYIEIITKGLPLPQIQIERFQVGLEELLSIFFIDEIVFLMMSRFHKIDMIVCSRAIAKKEVKEKIRNVCYHLVENSTACNLYGNILLSKLVGTHMPRKEKEIGQEFWLIRRDLDFEKAPDGGSPTILTQSNNGNHWKTRVYGSIDDMRDELKMTQFDDFYTFQQCIKKSWDVVAYGDVPTLLEKPEYITQNIKMIKSRKIKVRRLFIYPYPKKKFNAISTQLKGIKLDSPTLESIIRENDSTGIPEVNVDDMPKVITGISPEAIRAIKDIIYLIWLVKLHEDFNIDYRILSSNQTIDATGTDIAGVNLLNNWKDEGSASLDNEVIVRFDDKMQEEGVIYYQFIKDSKRISSYKNTFDIVWSTAKPTAYTYKEKVNDKGDKLTGSLLDFLSIFFNDLKTCKTLVDNIPKYDSWVKNIKP